MSVEVGTQVQASTGVWLGVPTGYVYQWQDSLDGTNLNGNITGETRSDYIAGVGEVGRWVRVEVIASNLIGDSSPVYSDWLGPVVSTAVPTRVTDPEATGEPNVGEIVGTTDGVWAQDPTSFAYQWQSSPDGLGSWSDIGGETDATLTIGGGLLGLFVRAQVVATNVSGDSDPAFSNALGPVVDAPLVPVNDVLPSVSGTAAVGHTLESDPGEWTNDPTSYTYQWQSSEDGMT